MEPPPKKRDIDFRQKPPTKEPPPPEFKVVRKRSPKGTLIAVVIFVVFTVLLWFAGPVALPPLYQKLTGLVHASSAAVVGIYAAREFWKKSSAHHPTHPHPTSDHGNQPATAAEEKKSAAKEQKEHLLQHLHQHPPVKGRKRMATLFGSLSFAAVLGLWFTPLAPIPVHYDEADLASQLDLAATTPFLVLVKSTIALPTPPQPWWSTSVTAAAEQPSRDAYRAAMQFLAKRAYTQASGKLELARQGCSLEPDEQWRIDLGFVQIELFQGNYAKALDLSTALVAKKKLPIIQAHQITAAIFAGQYAKARIWATQLRDSSKSASNDEKLRSVNLLMVLDLLQWRRDERIALESEVVKLLKESNGPVAAGLQNNLGVVKCFGNPPQIAAIQSQCNAALTGWSNHDQEQIRNKQRDRVASIGEQNIAVALWLASEADQGIDHLKLAEQLLAGNKLSPPREAVYAERLERIRLVLATALQDMTLGLYNKAESELNEAKLLSAGIPSTDPYQVTFRLLEIRMKLLQLNYFEADQRCEELLKPNFTTQFTPQHPLFISVRLRQIEALLGMKKWDQVKSGLASLTELMNNSQLTEHHDRLTLLRFQAQYELSQKENLAASKIALDTADALHKKLFADPTAQNKSRDSFEGANLTALRAQYAYLDGTGTAASKTLAAIELLKQAQQQLSNAIDPRYAESHPLGGRFIYLEARLLQSLQKHAEAEERLKFWEAEYLPTMPAKHPWSVDALNLLISVLKAQKKDAKAYEEMLKDF